jgi:hypothetical protein
MLIRACFSCKYHKVRTEEYQRSYCQKEYCWAEFSDCMSIKALEYFLSEHGVAGNETHTRVQILKSGGDAA